MPDYQRRDYRRVRRYPEEYEPYEDDRRRRIREDERRYERAQERVKPIKQPRRKRKAAKVLKGILIFLLILVIAAGVLWVIPGGKEILVKGVLKTPLATPIARLLIGSDYEKNVHDKDFDRSKLIKNDGAKVPGGNMSVALFGVDATKETLEGGTRADSMMVVNVDRKGDIKMASVFRDTYLLINSQDGNEIITKANAAYATGGPLGAVNMLNENFDLALEDYVVVNFWGFAKIVDLLGGLRLNVTEAEREEINAYIYFTSQVADIENKPLETSGENVLLTGDQATAFCRCRYLQFTSPLDGQTYSNDFARTARQRYALSSLFAQAREQGTFKMFQVMKAMFKSDGDGVKFIQTSMKLGTLVKFFSRGYEMNITANAAFPDPDHQYTAMLDSGDTMVADTLEENVTLMHEFLYDQSGYEPTPALSIVAEKIRAEVARQR